MPTPEQMLIDQIKEVELAQKSLSLKVSHLKLEALHAESDLISCKLEKEKLIEQLRVLRNRTVKVELTEREHEIERFRLVAPDIMKKI